MTFDEIIWHERAKAEAKAIVLSDPRDTTPTLRQMAWNVLRGMPILCKVRGKP
mgnify:CR=1 FL=1